MQTQVNLPWCDFTLLNVAFFFDGNPACSILVQLPLQHFQGTHVATGSMDNTAKLWDVGVAQKTGSQGDGCGEDFERVLFTC